jgi:amino acid transporter
MSLWDSLSVIVGIVVGASIFKVPSNVFSNVSSGWGGLGIWLIGGILSLIGALCYAELAVAYPRSGGDYVYLTRAFGRLLGFLFGWARLGGILTGSIGAMAYVVADYAVILAGLSPEWNVWIAVLAISGLTMLNVLGVALGKATQNVLTLAKMLGLAGIVVAGFLLGSETSFEPTLTPGPTTSNFGIALIFVLYAFGGWNDSAYLAAEVRDPRRNIPRALVLGISAITLVYLLVNAGYLIGLGFDRARVSAAPAADVLGLLLGEFGRKAMSLLVMISALGALNGMLFTGSRVHASMGADHRVFAVLGRWNRKSGSPVWALLIEAAVSILLVLVVGTSVGRARIDALIEAVGGNPLPWDTFYGGFQTLVAATAPVFWLFFLLTGVALFVLRFKDHSTERTFSVPLYPFVPLAFCATSAYMLYASIDYAGTLALLALLPVLIGIPVYFCSEQMRRG